MPLMDRSILFTPLKLKNITLPGRIVRAATEYFCASVDGHAAECEFVVYQRLGRQPLGMILTGNTCVSPEGRSNLWQNALWDDAYIPETRCIAKAAQACGIPAVMQLGHGGSRGEGNNGGLRVLTPDCMTIQDIKGVVHAFRDAALRAKQAGMRGVMLHCAHGFLLSQFFYPAYNHRTDRYGGSAENRFRIIREIMEAVKNACGDDYPLFIKINVTDVDKTDSYYTDLVTALTTSSDLLDAVETSGWDAIENGVARRPYFIDVVRRLHNDVEVPLIEVGGFRDAHGMLSALQAGASAVSISRPLLREADFATKIRDTVDAVSKCKGCGFCLNPLDTTTMIRCPFAEK